MSLLVTGGCGFIGSHFINAQKDTLTEGNRIVNLDAMYYCARENNVNASIRSNPLYHFVKGSVCNKDLVANILRVHNVTRIVHFAAQSHVQNSFTDSLQFTQDNVLGTHNLLECCREYGQIKLFVHVSTDEVYGETGSEMRTEQSLLCPTNPYAATKAGAELIARSYLQSFGIPVIITRGNNVYGRNQYPEKLIPRFIELLRKDKKLTIHGDGKAVRAFLHVDDTVRAFQAIVNKGQIGETYNIGCDDGMEYTVLQVGKMLVKLIKGNESKIEDWIETVEDRPFNDQRYLISNSKLKALGWSPTITFEDGLRALCTDASSLVSQCETS